MADATSSGTSFSSISQEKKLSPASPDQSVPSQSKAATRGSSRRTDSTKAWALPATADEDTIVFRNVVFPHRPPMRDETWVPGRESIVMDADEVRSQGSRTKAFNRKDRKGGAKIAKENRRGDRKERCAIGASPSEVFGRRDRLGQALGGERGVLLGGVDVGGYQAIVDFNIFDVPGILMFDIARDGGGRRFQKRFDHFAPEHDRVSVLARILRNDGPLPVRNGGGKRGAQSLDSCWGDGRPVDQGDHGCVPASVQNVLQADLQGAELSALRRRIDDQGCTGGVHGRRDRGSVLSRHHEDQVGWPR